MHIQARRIQARRIQARRIQARRIEARDKHPLQAAARSRHSWASWQLSAAAWSSEVGGGVPGGRFR
jgi:hypothetical protein